MNDRPMAFTDHLGELRNRLFRSVIAITIAFFIAYGFHEELFHILAAPILEGLRAHGIYQLQALDVTEAIVVYLEASLVGAIILAVPYVLYQVWAFIAPGLLDRERKAVLPILGLISAFFVLGLSFCYFVFLPMVVDFLVQFTIGAGDVALLPTLEKTFSLVTTFLLIFGLVFEMPLIMFFLAVLGVVSSAKFLRFSRYFVVVAFIVAAIFTPPDPLSQLLMAVPLCALYFVGVAFAWAGGALRRSGDKGLAHAVVAVVFLVFTLSVALAGWLWNRPSGADSTRSAVISGATFALRADPAARIGRAVVEGREGPPDMVAKTWILSAGPGGRAWAALEPVKGCPGVESPAWWKPSFGPVVCRVFGPEANNEDDGNDIFLSLDDRKRPVFGIALPACVSVLAPPGLLEDAGMRFWTEDSTTGLTTLTLSFDGPAATLTTLTEWVRGIKDRLSPGQTLPGLDNSVLGDVIAWSEGDIDVVQKDGETVISITSLPNRAARIAARLAAAGAAACGPTLP